MWPLIRRTLAIALTVIGLSILIYGLYLSNVNPRITREDNLAWCVFFIGAAIAGIGVCLPFVRPAFLPLVALASPFVVFFAMGLLFWVAVIGFGILQILTGA